MTLPSDLELAAWVDKHGFNDQYFLQAKYFKQDVMSGDMSVGEWLADQLLSWPGPEMWAQDYRNAAVRLAALSGYLYLPLEP